MSFTIIAVIIFIVAVIVIARIFGRSAKSALEMRAGETVISDESPVRVEQQTPIQTGIFRRCRVIVTDRRILIAQAAVFSKTYNIPRFLVTLSDIENQTDLGSTVKKGFLVITVPRSSVQIEALNTLESNSRVTIPVPDASLTSGQFIKFSTKHPEGFR